MSRHFVNKVIRAAMISDAGFAAFTADTAAFIAPYDLTEPEKGALLERDFPALYAMGAHPFLLNALVMMFAEPGNERAHAAAYRASIAPYGRPDFGT